MDLQSTEETIGTIPTVQKAQDTEINEQNKKTVKSNKLDVVTQRVRSNKILFYGLPLLVIAYGIGIVTFIVVPGIEKYSQTRNDTEILDQNISNMQQSSFNLRQAIFTMSEYDSYETSLSTQIPTEARIGQLIDTLQKQANDFGLEKAEFSTPDPSTAGDDNKSSIDNLAKLDEDNKALFQSVNAGEVEFTPKSLSEGTKARLLEIDMTVKGNKDGLFDFLHAVSEMRPLINLVYIDYQEVPDLSGSPTVTASLRFESYALKLNTNRTLLPRKAKITDISLTSVLPVETFTISGEIKRTLESEQIENNPQ